MEIRAGSVSDRGDRQVRMLQWNFNRVLTVEIFADTASIAIRIFSRSRR